MLGAPDTSVRSTSVFTKNPTRSSSALSVRPAIGLPSAMSLPPPSRLSSPTNPACNTMNRLAPPQRTKPQKPSMQLPVQQNPNAPAAMARHRRPRTVARQLDLLRQALQMLPPERQLARDRAPLLALAAQHLLLPQRVVRILHRKRRKP